MGFLVMTEENLPVEASKSGDNAHYISCEEYGGYRAYAVCLHVIEAYQKGSPRWQDPECNFAITKKTCPAMELRKQELEAGRALFYRQRSPLLPKVTPSNPDPASICVYDPRWRDAQKLLGREFKEESGSKKREVKRVVARASHTPNDIKARRNVVLGPLPGISADNLHARLVNQMMDERVKKNEEQ